jgi:hypothetical protein
MSVEWHNSSDEGKPAQQNQIFRTDVSSGDNNQPVFNNYRFNLGPMPDSSIADGLNFKAYSISGRSVETLGEVSILFDQMGDLFGEVKKSLSLHS